MSGGNSEFLQRLVRFYNPCPSLNNLLAEASDMPTRKERKCGKEKKNKEKGKEKKRNKDTTGISKNITNSSRVVDYW
jgi:hypothetical protein